MSKYHKIQHATVNDIVSDKERRQIPQVHPDDGVAEIVAAFKKSRHARLVYVVDENQHLSGAISLGNLAKHLLFHLNDKEIDNLHLMDMALAETAMDYIDRPVVSAKISDNIEPVLANMLKASIKEIPIVDDQKKLVADLTLVDILDCCLEDLLDT
ncbi:MAG: CBS domain-containing protein [Desulfobulbaceae bacterium]|uniref:CBS domain-containing protein n=1 Tax=Candidatus Desulfobia pelagia TaxID=2841692 RepID=A0A8J6THE2_9BACT|nr:CBS domain-containing protein [Candidatus Desulfobia pelagia]